jgi:hypothetical protein
MPDRRFPLNGESTLSRFVGGLGLDQILPDGVNVALDVGTRPHSFTIVTGRSSGKYIDLGLEPGQPACGQQGTQARPGLSYLLLQLLALRQLMLGIG